MFLIYLIFLPLLLKGQFPLGNQNQIPFLSEPHHQPPHPGPQHPGPHNRHHQPHPEMHPPHHEGRKMGNNFPLGGPIPFIPPQINNIVGIFSETMFQNIDEVTHTVFQGPSRRWKFPPHMIRRMVRFCRRHPQAPKCQNLPPKIRSKFERFNAGPNIGGLNFWDRDVFTGLKHYERPQMRRIRLPNILQGVPPTFHKHIPRALYGNIESVYKNKIMQICQSKSCKEQPEDAIDKRASIADGLLAFQYFLTPNQSIEQMDQTIETNLMRTMQVKEALLKNAGLDGQVEPVNDGTFQHDILLTEEQSNIMLNQISDAGGATEGRRKRSSLFLEGVPTSKWPITEKIKYTFDATMDENNKATVRSAIKEIETKTCVRFVYTATKPSTPHLYYIKYASGTFCGLSYIGRVLSSNPIYLSFSCENSVGIAIHETLHALGLNHEQIRGDRDEYITVNWENINPQQYDFFAVADSKQFTSYGVEYDYGSIMHYDQLIASSNGKPSMTAKINPSMNQRMMGQRRGLSERDVEIIQKMFCMPGCEDKNVYCGHWSLKNLCGIPGTPTQNSWMVQNCQKSCGFCGF
uniref:Metalloendopeptidase n=1 Tax=Parastrongyloides trichosuri TaxID=131310 RepID=A0A0N4ZIU6_PARTI